MTDLPGLRGAGLVNIGQNSIFCPMSATWRPGPRFLPNLVKIGPRCRLGHGLQVPQGLNPASSACRRSSKSRVQCLQQKAGQLERWNTPLLTFARYFPTSSGATTQVLRHSQGGTGFVACQRPRRACRACSSICFQSLQKGKSQYFSNIHAHPPAIIASFIFRPSVKTSPTVRLWRSLVMGLMDTVL